MSDVQDWHDTDALHAEQGKGDPFAAAVRATRMPMIVTDPRRDDNPIVFANAAFLALTGYAHDEVIGRNCRLLQGRDTDPASVAAIRAAVEGRHDISIDLLNYRKDGTPFWNALYLSPVTTAAGELQFFFASQMDITDRVEVQLFLTEQREVLEREVARRTKDLQDALTAKTLLIHEVDHRVKNNLQMISSLLAMQSRGVKDPLASDILKGALQRVEAIGTVHRRLYQSNDVSRFDLSDFARDIFVETVKGSGRSDVALALDLEPVTVPSQQASPIALLLNELVINALKHAFPHGRGGTLSVSIRVRDERLAVVMGDNGVGMPAGQPEPATGFGSRLVRSMVRQLRGSVSWRDGNPGTVVSLSFPLSSIETVETDDE